MKGPLKNHHRTQRLCQRTLLVGKSCKHFGLKYWIDERQLSFSKGRRGSKPLGGRMKGPLNNYHRMHVTLVSDVGWYIGEQSNSMLAPTIKLKGEQTNGMLAPTIKLTNHNFINI